MRHNIFPTVFRFLRDGGVRLRCLAQVPRGKKRRIGARSAYTETSVHRHQSGVLKSEGGRGPEADGPPFDRLNLIDRSIHIVTFVRGQLFCKSGVFLSRAESQIATRTARASLGSTLFPFARTCVSRVFLCARTFDFTYTRARVHSTFLSSIFFLFFLYL